MKIGNHRSHKKKMQSRIWYRAEHLTLFLGPVWENRVGSEAAQEAPGKRHEPPHCPHPQITILILHPEQTSSELRENLSEQAMNVNGQLERNWNVQASYQAHKEQQSQG